MGRYARHYRCPSHFVFKILDGLRSEHATLLIYARVTVYSALSTVLGTSNVLVQHLRGMTIDVVRISGLKHQAIKFARAMGADRVVGISRSEDKRSSSFELGAYDYIATNEEID